ncbi:hypothetical protein M427DRAFT_136343 [Gonapodya prolifera JEL478]|uniref:Uncharacterized protein n=1 Tax=Gonapodya prolifera (strain JEL478) TaxID=1344416 RepID=A0A139ABC5_GONPJ|nr:hypothetical protein M427DRAFT_136343 [Gonapodya prolifera JEL478]|eukprot:KXS13765.1 hypothetical protein M427DRAFT_136343 [Gonapodya prolifera JEL478]
MPQLFDGTKTGWGMRPGREGAVLGMWPLFRKDADSCACMKAIASSLPDGTKGKVSPYRKYLWESVTSVVCS